MGFRTFKNGLDTDVEALRENTERELFLEVGGEDMVDRGRDSASPKDAGSRDHCAVQPEARGLSRFAVTPCYV